MVMNKKDFYTLIGFILFILGFTALALSLVGIQWSFLSWMKKIDPVFSLVMHLLMIIVGIVLVAYQKIDWKEDIT